MWECTQQLQAHLHEGLVNVLEALGLSGQLLDNVAATEDSLHVHPHVLHHEPLLHDLADSAQLHNPSSDIIPAGGSPAQVSLPPAGKAHFQVGPETSLHGLYVGYNEHLPVQDSSHLKGVLYLLLAMLPSVIWLSSSFSTSSAVSEACSHKTQFPQIATAASELTVTDVHPVNWKACPDRGLSSQGRQAGSRAMYNRCLQIVLTLRMTGPLVL